MKKRNFPPVKNVVVKRTKNGQRYLYHLKDNFGNDVYQTIQINDSDTKEAYFKKIEEARIKLEQKINHVSMEELLNEYIKEKNYAKSSAVCLRVSVRGFNLDPENNTKQINSIVNADTKPGTKTVRVSLIRNFFRWLISAKRISIPNPADTVILRTTPHYRARTLDESEVKNLLEKIEGTRSKEMILFTRLLVFTGARISSIHEITPKSLRNSRLYLYNVKCHRDYSYAIPIRDERTLELFHELASAGDGKIFKRSLDSLKYSLNHFLRQMFPPNENGETISAHSLRHTFATHALQKGIPPEIVSRMLDHSSINTTLIIYAKHSQKQIDDAVALLFDEKKGDPKSED